jgi:proliferating cell nuclear antigen
MIKQKKTTEQPVRSIQNSDIKNLDSYLMYLKTVQAAAIRTLSEASKEVLADVNIYFDKTGWRIMDIDPSNTAFVYLKLDSDKFDNYYCPTPIPVDVSMISLHKLLKTINNSDIITFFIEKNDSQRLGIKIENHEKRISSIAKLGLLDIDDSGIEIPDIEFDLTYTMPCTDFQKQCRDLANIADNVEIYSKGNMFSLTVKGGFADQTIKIGEETPEDESDISMPIFIGEYQLKFLNLFCKSSGLCPTVEIYLKKKFPIILSYSVAALGTVKFGLSPNSNKEE